MKPVIATINYYDIKEYQDGWKFAICLLMFIPRNEQNTTL
jgi:hypothetical protein